MDRRFPAAVRSRYGHAVSGFMCGTARTERPVRPTLHEMASVPRRRVSPGALYSLLAGELRARRVADCMCRMPLPIVVDRSDPAAANWHLDNPAKCEHGCELLIAQILASLASKYDLVDLRPAAPSPGPA
jgi:hypothetical protein